MGRMNVTMLRYLSKDDFRILTAVQEYNIQSVKCNTMQQDHFQLEMGMKNHELVPTPLTALIANIHNGIVSKRLRDLVQHRLVSYENSKRYDGYRLTNLGYDYLALKALSSGDTVVSMGRQIGVGKESDIYLAVDAEYKQIVIKVHRLGRTSFRKIREKRDYHKTGRRCSWIYLSRLAATKEFAFLNVLYSHNFPVPQPLNHNRHCVVMTLIEGPPLAHVNSLQDPEDLYDDLMELIVRLARHGLIHGDFNEFNIMIDSDENPVLIDFPQMISVDHPNAQEFFDRDVQCIREFFRKRFGFESEQFPSFAELEREFNLDVEVEASGFTKQMARDLEMVSESGQAGDEETEDEDKCKSATTWKSIGRLKDWLDETITHLEQVEIESAFDDERTLDDYDSDYINGIRIEEPSIASTTGSTMDPTIVRNRIRMEIIKKHRHEQQRRAKRKAAAKVSTRDRKANNTLIRDDQGWEHAFR